MTCRQHFQDKNSGGIQVNFSRQLYVREKNDSFTACWIILCFLSSVDFFKINLLKQIFQEYHQSVNFFFDPDKTRPFVGPDPRVQTVSKDCQQTTL